MYTQINNNSTRILVCGELNSKKKLYIYLSVKSKSS